MTEPHIPSNDTNPESPLNAAQAPAYAHREAAQPPT